MWWLIGGMVWLLAILMIIGFFEIATASDPKEPGEPD